jgi:hypothetical protein
MTVIYYNGVHWFTNPHLVHNCDPWCLVMLGAITNPYFDKQPAARQRQLLWFSQTIHVRNEMGIFDNAFNNGETGDSTQVFQDPDFGLQHPTLHAFLTSTVDDAGKVRKVSTLLIFCEDGTCKGVLRERMHDLSLWVTAKSILGVFEAVEEALKKRPIEWRKNNNNGSTSRTKWK